MNNTNILFRDLYGITLVLFIGLVALLMTLEKAQSSQDGEVKSPGNLTANISWTEGHIDVDLWVDGPGEIVPVGYSNKGGVLWNLLRDDLGNIPDYTKLNYENAYTRGVPPGDYRINVDCFHCPLVPVEVLLEVALKTAAEDSAKVVATSSITLTADNQEKTALAFTVLADGTVDPASLSTIFAPLRPAR